MKDDWKSQLRKIGEQLGHLENHKGKSELKGGKNVKNRVISKEVQNKKNDKINHSYEKVSADEKENNISLNSEFKISNLGYAFQTQDYYLRKTKIEDDIQRIIDFKLQEKTKEMIKKRQVELKYLIKQQETDEKIACFQATVCYPGLVIGMSNPIMCSLKEGIAEGSKADKENQNNIFKTGIAFDYVTGLPYIQGSSIKGMLRASIKKYRGDVEIWLKKNLSDDMIKQLFGDENDDDLEKNLEKNKRDNTNVSQRDVFLDAIVVDGDKEGKVLKSDYITPHLSMFKNPVPIRILALKPNVKIQFYFLLREKIIAGMNKEQRFELYKNLILDLGVGAKTNTGYGCLTEV